MDPLIQISVTTLRYSTHGKSWSKADSDVSWFRLGRKTANSTGAVRWSTNSIRQVRLLSAVNKIYSLYNDKKKRIMYNNNNNKRFQFGDKWTGDNSSPRVRFGQTNVARNGQVEDSGKSGCGGEECCKDSKFFVCGTRF